MEDEECLSLWLAPHSITFFFFSLNTYTHETPPCPPPPTITSIAPLRHTQTHTHTRTHTPLRHRQHQTEKQQQHQLAVCHVLWCAWLCDCHTSTLSAPRCCSGRRRGKLTRLCGKCMSLQREHCREITALCRTALGMLSSARKVALGEWWSTDGMAVGSMLQKRTLTSRINVPYRPYLSALRLFQCALGKLQLFQCFHSFSHTACKWKVHTQVVKVKQFWSVSRGLALSNLRADSKVKSIHSSFAAGWHQVSYLCWCVCVLCVCV